MIPPSEREREREREFLLKFTIRQNERQHMGTINERESLQSREKSQVFKKNVLSRQCEKEWLGQLIAVSCKKSWPKLGRNRK